MNYPVYIYLYNDKQHVRLDAHKICSNGLIFYQKQTNEMGVEKKEKGKCKKTKKCENQTGQPMNEDMWIKRKENSKSKNKK